MGFIPQIIDDSNNEDKMGETVSTFEQLVDIMRSFRDVQNNTIILYYPRIIQYLSLFVKNSNL